jgi:hypothetical protein
VAQGARPAAGIYSPPVGSVVSGPVRVLGMAMFDPTEVQFYKVEFGYGSRPDDWITMGELHAYPVANGWLETWHADSLPSGNYALRVVLVKRDGNFIASAPYPVEVRR